MLIFSFFKKQSMIPLAVRVFVGMTSKKLLSKKVGIQSILDNYLHKAISGQKVFIHPKLSTSEVIWFRKPHTLWTLFQEFVVSPDIALIKLSQSVKFNENIKPICLSNKLVQEKPLCTDASRDKGRFFFICHKFWCMCKFSDYRWK